MYRSLLLLSSFVLTACASSGAQPSAATEPPASPAVTAAALPTHTIAHAPTLEPEAGSPVEASNLPPAQSASGLLPSLPPGAAVIELPEFESLWLAAAGETVFAVAGFQGGLYLSHASGGAFMPYSKATGDTTAFVLAVERPALAVAPDGSVGVAWFEITPASSFRVWYARSGDSGQTFEPGVVAATSDGYEVAMIRLGYDAHSQPLLTWLDSGQLMFARSHDGGLTFTEAQAIDGRVCDCCQPQPVVVADTVVIAYRNVDEDSVGQHRDVAVVRSPDGGQTFDPPIPVADAHWYLSACPISGPSLWVDESRLHLIWMDARFDTQKTLAESDIWLSTSDDFGETFTPDLRLTNLPGHYNTLPVIAAGPGGRLHVAWESHADSDTFIFYATSDDGGRTFSPPQPLVASGEAPERGRVGQPALAVSALGEVHLGWVDRQGARVAIWVDTK